MNFLKHRRNGKSTGKESSTDDSSDPGLPPPNTPGGMTAGLDARDSTISSSDYARRCKDIMELYNELQALDVQADFDSILPRVVVIGGQSSGKSSLVEAVSGINVPRDSGTCTRCPMECTMSSNANAWSCEIFIRREYDTQGKRIEGASTKPFGGQITDKTNVEICVRRAQAAVLSPHKSPTEFETMSKAEIKALMEHDKKILQFSKNVVVIKVRDPEATDLSFVDLPGLIQYSEDEKLIPTVKGLVEQYIQGKSTLIVIAMPVTDDYENLQAVTIAKYPRADPDGSRTIGVLTKPDMLGENNIGARKNWKEVLDGSRHATKHGYFCVRLPDDVQREAGITKEEVQGNADDYFSSTLPWNQMTDRSRFGIPNFVQFVSKLLIKLIEKSLPSLRGKVEEKLQQCLTDLEGIPPLPQGHPSTEVLMRITNFCRAINDAVSGEKYKDFVQSNLVTYSTFKSEIVATAPEFRPFEGSASSLENKRRCVSCTKFVPESQTEARGLDLVRHRIKLSITWELPGHIPFEVTKNLLRDYVDLWAEPTSDCFHEANATMTQLLVTLLDEYFGQYQFFKKYISDLTIKEQETCGEETEEMLEKVLQMEKNPLYTQNSDVLSSQRSAWKASLLREAGRYGAESTSHRCSSSQRSHITHRFANASSNADDSRPKTWSVDDEIEIMAGVQAYFHVAHQRIIDYIPLAIEHDLNQNLAENIGNILIDKVMQDTADQRVTFEQLLSEDPVIAARRKELQDRRSRLLKIKAILDEFKHLEPAAPSTPSAATEALDSEEEEDDDASLHGNLYALQE